MSDNKPVKIKHGLNSPKIRLNAPCPTAKGKFSSLSWDLYMNNPRVVVAVNDPAFATPDKSYGRIQAAMEMPTFYLFLSKLKEAISSEGPVKTQLKLFGNAKGGGGGGGGYQEPVHLTDLWIGKDADGCVFLSVVKKEEGWPVIKFIFAAPDPRFVKVFKGDGTEYSKSELSVAYAQSYHDLLSHAMGTAVMTTYVEPPPFIPGNKGGGGGYSNNRSGGGGGYQNRSAPTGGGDEQDPDLPF
jgi:hypothetical protein